MQDLTVELPTAAGWVRRVNEVSLRIGAGESVGLVGESGSGKTMLSLVVMGLLPAGAKTKGAVRLMDVFNGRHSGDNPEEKSASERNGGRNLLGLAESEWRKVRGREIAMVFQEPMTSLNPVMRVGERIAVMRAGKFVEVGTTEDILKTPANEYTRELLAAAPKIQSGVT